jgi:hypothetical protein
MKKEHLKIKVSELKENYERKMKSLKGRLCKKSIYELDKLYDISYCERK